MNRHAALMDAAGYWKQFVVNFYFDNAGDQVQGHILELLYAKKDDPPRFKLQTPEGLVFVVVAQQARLKFELVKASPAVGDKIRITYNGEAEKAAPGMNKAKDFTVEIWRQGSGPQAENDAPNPGQIGVGDGGSGGRK